MIKFRDVTDRATFQSGLFVVACGMGIPFGPKNSDCIVCAFIFLCQKFLKNECRLLFLNSFLGVHCGFDDSVKLRFLRSVIFLGVRQLPWKLNVTRVGTEIKIPISPSLYPKTE